MDYQTIQNFLASPNLGDVISYVLLLVSYIVIFFVKQYVKKDNKTTIAKVDIKTANLNAIQAKLEESNSKHEQEREQWKKEKEELIKEIKEIKKAVRICATNSKELVKTGISNHVSKMLPVEDSDTVIITEPTENKTISVED